MGGSEIVEGFRLSPQQRTLWRLHAGPGVGPYRALAVALLEGPCEPARLRDAADALAERHELLRTSFQRLPGIQLPVQVIAERVEAELEVLGPWPGLEPAAAAERLLAHGGAWDWQLDRPPLLRLALAELGPARHALLLGSPAHLCDAAGLVALARELAARLAGAAGGAADGADGGADGEELLQYADLAEWQNELLEGEEGSAGRAAWRAAGVPADPRFELALASRIPHAPYESAHASLPATNGSGATASEGVERRVVPVPLPADVAAALAAPAAWRGSAEPEDVLLAAWQVLLGALAGQEDFVVGLGCDGRTFPELERSPGAFARELPVRASLRADEAFAELVQRCAAARAEAFGRQELFSWDELAGEGSVPAFTATFTCERLDGPARVGELVLGVLRTLAPCGPPALALHARRFPERVELELRCAPALHDEADVRRVAGELAHLLGDAVRDPRRPIDRLELVPPDERRLLLGPLAAGGAGPADPRPVHELFAELAARRPAAPALLSDRGTLSYGELAGAARRLARRLVAAGVGPDVPVAVCVERSPEMVVALLAVLEAGGAYVPLDPGYPQERIAFVLGDCGAAVLLTRAGLLERLPAPGAGLQVLLLDADAEGARDGVGPEDAPLVAAGRTRTGHLAYVIYTSGSTGRPKGVEVSHGSLAHSTAARALIYPEAPERFLLVSSFAFDSSVVGLWWTLSTGGALVLPAEGEERDARALVQRLEREQATTLLALPSLHGLLLEQPEAARRLRSLRTVIVAGEACPRELVLLHRRTLPQARLFDEYGPTEATVWSTVFDCGELADEGPVPIGRPIPGARVRVLGPGLRLLPLGAPGELLVGGPGLARGYRGRPEATAERFLDDPFAGDPSLGEGEGTGAADPRLYRTGDLVRLRADGLLEFLGRVDHQVKVRGYRIELEEIEAVLGASPGVAEACVAAREDAPGLVRLVAYVVGRGAAPDPEALRARVAAACPEFMVPSAFVVLPALPRTPNGKVDRKALPAPEAGRPRLSRPFVAPRTQLEEAVAAVWAEVLGIEAVGVEDDFFELGGHSILAVRLVTRLEDALRTEVGLRTLFDAPTIAGLLEALRREPGARARLERAEAVLAELAELSDEELEQALGEEAGGRAG